MLLLGLDIGTSSIKATVVDGQTQKILASVSYPEEETEIIVPQIGWAEQNPEIWWKNVQQAVLACHATRKYNPKDISAIGIAYQMHGLVLVDNDQNVLHNSIIWCDSRAIGIGEKAFFEIGKDKCLSHLLNSPGNFTASKLAWIKSYKPDLYKKIDKVMLPGDFISMKLTGAITTNITALSEGIFWDFKEDKISEDVLKYFDFDKTLLPSILPHFSGYGELTGENALNLSLKPNIPVTYKAGDQPNNALTLNVMKPGEVAANAGTSGVLYGINNQLAYDKQSRVNSFAHVNYSPQNRKIGTLLCINGTGIFNRWVKDIIGTSLSYVEMNIMAQGVDEGAEGLFAIPFGNGAERMLNNKVIGGHFLNLDFNRHSAAHLLRSLQEGIAFSFRYGLDIMRENGINPSVVKASKANMFLSPVFAQTFSDVNNVTTKFFEGDGSFGAAIGAGVGVGLYKDAESALQNRKPIGMLVPDHTKRYEELYQEWKNLLDKFL